MRGFGEAKEMCRLYLAAQAEESAHESDGFRLGGNRRTFAQVVAPHDEEQAESEHGEDAEADALSFDPDEELSVSGGAEIESAAFHLAGGVRLPVAGGGEAVDVRIVCRATRMVTQPVIAFVVRDRLGQILFSDDTYAVAADAVHDIPPGESFTAIFSFFLPYLASGAYAVEAFVFERAAGAIALLQRRQDKEFLYVQSTHPSNGLANIGMRAVTLTVVAEEPQRSTHGASAEGATSFATGAAR
jgi:lipopolysaccharide transport system ATP-binding protein